MPAAKPPANEAARLKALQELGVLFTPAEERFDRITRLAAEVFNVPTALVSLVAEDCQWFKSTQGLAATETPRDVAFCAHAILADDALIVENATRDERFADNPLVTGDPNIRFYAGQPLTAKNGQKMGTLCLIDSKPRQFNEQERHKLNELAKLVEEELNRNSLSLEQDALAWNQKTEGEQRDSIDPVTRLWGHAATVEIVTKEFARIKNGVAAYLVLFKIENLEQTISSKSIEKADAMLADFAMILRRNTVKETSVIGRYADDVFLCLLSDCTEGQMNAVVQDILKAVETYNQTAAPAITLKTACLAYDTSYKTAEAFFSAAAKNL